MTRKPIGAAALLLASAACSSALAAGGDVAKIKLNWATFFSSKTTIAKKASLLENGAQFKAVLEAQSTSAYAQNSTASVSKVTLAGSKAMVVYTISISGKPFLQGLKGLALRVGGKWVVSDATFCGLLVLQGPPPAPCPSS